MTLKLRIAEIPLFQFMTNEEGNRLSPLAKVIEKRPGEVVLLKGEGVPGIFIVAEGEVGVYPEGSSRQLAVISQGGSFGEMSALEQLKASATIRASKPGTKLILFEKDTLAKATASDSVMGMHFNRGVALTLSQKLRQTNQQIGIELVQGRNFFRKLADIDGSLSSINKVRPLAQKRFVAVEERLEGVRKLVEELRTALPEKGGSLGEISLAIDSTRTELRKLHSSLLGQLDSMVEFIESIEGFLLTSQIQQ